MIWKHNNKNRVAISDKKIKQTRKRREQTRKAISKHRENGGRKKWEDNNRDKLKQYRELHKNHEISKKEWQACLKYFNNSCAYCGMSNEDHKKKYKQQLHKEHVDDNGSNKLDNCVPSCKLCNSSKKGFILEEWYYKNDFSNHTKDRLDKIYKWINEDYKNNKSNKKDILLGKEENKDNKNK